MKAGSGAQTKCQCEGTSKRSWPSLAENSNYVGDEGREVERDSGSASLSLSLSLEPASAKSSSTDDATEGCFISRG